MFKRLLLKELLPNVKRLPVFLPYASSLWITSTRTQSSDVIHDDKNSLQVTVLDSKGNLLGLKTKAEAMELAKVKNMELEAVDEKITPYKKYPVYQLKTLSQILKETGAGQPIALEKRKNIVIKSSIANHDLQFKVKAIMKMIKKGESVVVVVKGDKKEPRREEIFKQLENDLKDDSRIINTSTSKLYIKLVCGPLSKEKTCPPEKPTS